MNLGPLHWELRVLATGPPGKSRQLIILNQVKMPTAMAFEDVTSFLEQILVHSYESESESEVAQSCPSLRNPVDCSPPDSSVLEIPPARILSGLPFPPPEDLPDPGIEPAFPALQVDSSLLTHWGSPIFAYINISCV